MSKLSDRFKEFAAKRQQTKQQEETLSEKEKWRLHKRKGVENRKYARTGVRSRSLSPRSAQDK